MQGIGDAMNGGAWRATAALAVGQTTGYAAMFYVFPALLAAWEAEFGPGGPPPALGLTLALGVAAFAAPAAGRAVDRGRAPLMMPAAALLGAVLLAGLSRADDVRVFLLLWAALGFAIAGALYEPCFALLTRARGAEARRAIAAVTLVAGFATALAYPLSAALEAAFGWRGAVLGMAAMLAAITVPALAWGAWATERGASADSTARAAPAAGPGPGWRAEWRRPGAIRLAVAFAAFGATHGMITAHILPLLGARGLDGAAAVAVAASVGPMQVAGRVLLLTAPKRWRAVSLSAVSLALAAAGIGALGLGHGPVAAWAFAGMLGFAVGALTILRPAALAETAGTERFGALSGLVAAPVAASLALAPLAGGALRAAGGADLALAVAAALPLVGLAALAPLLRRR